MSHVTSKSFDNYHNPRFLNSQSSDGYAANHAYQQHNYIHQQNLSQNVKVFEEQHQYQYHHEKQPSNVSSSHDSNKFNQKIILNHSKIYEDSQEQDEDDDNLEEKYYNPNEQSNNLIIEENSLESKKQLYEDSFEEEEKKLQIESIIKKQSLPRDQHQHHQYDNIVEYQHQFEQFQHHQHHMPLQQKMQLQEIQQRELDPKNFKRIRVSNEYKKEQQDQLKDLTPGSPSTNNNSGILFQRMYGNDKDQSMIHKSPNSPVDGTNREWALETLLKDEKVNVKHLEQRNQALKDRIQNLENMLKTSGTSANHNNINNSIAVNHLDSMSQNVLTNTHTMTMDNDNSKTASQYTSTMILNSPKEDPHKQYLLQKMDQIQYLNQQYDVENQRLKARLDDVLNRLEDFEAEKQALKYDNNKMMNELEMRIQDLQLELSQAHHTSLHEKDQTISQLQEHIKLLENQIYNQEIQNSQTQSAKHQHLEKTPLFQQSQTSFGGNNSGDQNVYRYNSRGYQTLVNSQGVPNGQDTGNVNDNDANNSSTGQAFQEQVRQLELQLQETKQYYVSKLSLLERQQKLQQTFAKNQTLSSDQRELTFGEKQRLFDQIALVEEDRDQALRKIKVLENENQLLMRIKNADQDTQQSIQGQSVDSIIECILNPKIREITDILMMIEDAIQIGEPNKDLYFILENLISQIESMNNQRIFSKSQIKLFEDLTETCLLISQMKEQREIIDTLHKMRQFTMIELQQLVQSQAQTAQLQPEKDEGIQAKDLENEMDEYWSDFSDDDFYIEEQEEKEVLKEFYSLQQWILQFIKQSDVDLLKLLQSQERDYENLISLRDLLHSLIKIGYNSNFVQLANLLKYMEHQRPNYIEYRQFIKNIQVKPYSWWQEIILNNCFEIRSQINKEGDFNSNLPRLKNNEADFMFYINLISEKLTCKQQQLDKFQSLLSDEQTNYLTKRGFRKFVLDQRVNLTRFECHLFIKYLENDGKIFKSDLFEFLSNPYEFKPQKQKNQHTNEEKYQENKHQVQEFNDFLHIINNHIQENRFNIEEWFRCFDQLHNGTIDLHGFNQVFKNMQIPLSKIEIYSIFKYLLQRQNPSMKNLQVGDQSRLHFSSFVKTLNIIQKQQEREGITYNLPLQKAISHQDLDIQPNLNLKQRQLQKGGKKITDEGQNDFNQTFLSMSDRNYDVNKENFNKVSNATADESKKFDRCKSAIKIADLKIKIEKLVQKNSQNLQKSGLGNMGSTLGKASQLKINTIRDEFEKEKQEMSKQLQMKNKEIEGFSKELEIILKEMEVLQIKQHNKPQRLRNN
ncbi:UNKNOWN [Stylonychia lemnae]|uniref:EF-hand domain-containing protein n=1 Tax=Stylonychia lemnae TaxID=5949 RepID=A0A078B280_STYLE|nr:UNKNOWN [Stylonychia lemnae]|eukprot:CDW87548.1 UNKNOWN [Stylonychia lemnae]